MEKKVIVNKIEIAGTMGSRDQNCSIYYMGKFEVEDVFLGMLKFTALGSGKRNHGTCRDTFSKGFTFYTATNLVREMM